VLFHYVLLWVWAYYAQVQFEKNHPNSPTDTWAILKYLHEHERWTLELSVLFVLHIFIGTLLLLSQVWLIGRNLTTLEGTRMRGSEQNKYDKGCVNNYYSFFCSGKKDLVQV